MKSNHTKPTFIEKTLEEFKEKYKFEREFSGEYLAGLNMLKADMENFLTKALQEAEKIGMEKGVSEVFDAWISRNTYGHFDAWLAKKLYKVKSELKSKEERE